MKRLTTNRLAKTIAIFLAILSATTLLLCGAISAFFAATDSYSGSTPYFTESGFYDETAATYEDDARTLFGYTTLIKNAGANAERCKRVLAYENTNFRYSIADANGAIVQGTMTQDGAASKETPQKDARSYRERAYAGNGETYVLMSWVDESFPVADAFSRRASLFNGAYAFRWGFLVLTATALVATCALLVFLCCTAGRYADAPEPQVRYLNRLPIDLYFALFVGLVALMVAMCASLWSASMEFSALATAFCTVCASALGVGFVMAFAARVKTRTFFRSSVIGTCLRLLWRFVKWVCGGIAGLFRNLPLLWRYILGYAAFGVVNLLAVAAHSGLIVLLAFAADVAALVLLCRAALAFSKLQKASAALAGGDLTYAVDTAKMPREMRTHGENLNSVRNAVSSAVEARMKSERMKTDLITNVSHDIKTPLTCIVSYIDLLQKEDLHNETATGYVEVLARQAERLKKLTCDIVDASKASSGALQVTLTRIDLGEFANQCAAEYTERFSAAGMTFSCAAPEKPLYVTADGKLLWRVLDNLLNNAVKYALPGTRVYFDILSDDVSGAAVLKNVSREPLNISADELTERFVRGDASRASEGSGLGLSIAKDLAALQGGRLVLSVDGDLFKAEVRLPLAP